MNILAENKYGHGAVRDRIDTRDKQWSDIGRSYAPHDWSKDFDVEQLVGKLVTKDQGTSSSCGGQAWSYYGEVLSTIFDKIYVPRSAKFIYSQTFIPGGGSAGRDNCNILIKQGLADEKLLPSYENGNPPSEAFMERSQDITSTIRVNAARDEALAYSYVEADIESIAQAISSNYGCVLGITGQNNGTWLSEFPKQPIGTDNTWNHWVYAGKLKTINGKKFVGIKNSWGDNVGDYGWQWLGEEYFKGDNIFGVWTLSFKQSPLQPLKFIFNQDMHFGQNSADVLQLQKRLGVWQSGWFGPFTYAAVILYQKWHGLPETGYVGPLTRAMLNN